MASEERETPGSRDYCYARPHGLAARDGAGDYAWRVPGW